jgi:shikimate dehydrogenase
MTRQKTYGLIGYPTKHSLSPLMHNAAFKALKIDAEYKLFKVKPEELEDFLLNNISV